jgi:hypothetical protein
MLLCWSAKGGSGTTVITAALALVRSRSRPTVLADLCGDLPAALGLSQPSGPGVTDWLASPTACTAALRRLSVEVTDGLRLLPHGSGLQAAHPRWADLAAALSSLGDDVVIDAGLGAPPAPLVAVADHSLLVIRPCYLALRRAVALPTSPTGVVLISEPGRSLGVGDVERAVGAPVIAEVPFDPAICRAVDSGMLASRLPKSLSTSLKDAA